MKTCQNCKHLIGPWEHTQNETDSYPSVDRVEHRDMDWGCQLGMLHLLVPENWDFPEFDSMESDEDEMKYFGKICEEYDAENKQV